MILSMETRSLLKKKKQKKKGYCREQHYSIKKNSQVAQWNQEQGVWPLNSDVGQTAR